MSRQLSPRTLVEAFLPFEGTVDLMKVYDAAQLVNLEDQPVRLAIRRLIAAGEITQSGRGRGGRLELTRAGRERLSADRAAVQLVFAQDLGHAKWDGFWRLLAVSAPESERAVRDAFRRDVVKLGGVACSTGLYITPHDLTPLLSPDVNRYLVAAKAEEVTVRGASDPKQLTELLWPAESVTDGYMKLDQALDALAQETSPLVTQIRLADALESALRHDPLIPPELRGEFWQPAEVRRRWLELWSQAHADGGERRIFHGWLEE